MLLFSDSLFLHMDKSKYISVIDNPVLVVWIVNVLQRTICYRCGHQSVMLLGGGETLRDWGLLGGSRPLYEGDIGTMPLSPSLLAS